MRKTFKALKEIMLAKKENALYLANNASSLEEQLTNEALAKTCEDVICLLEFDNEYFTSIYNIWKD